MKKTSKIKMGWTTSKMTTAQTSQMIPVSHFQPTQSPDSQANSKIKKTKLPYTEPHQNI